VELDQYPAALTTLWLGVLNNDATQLTSYYNVAANGQASGPPAPPRDGLAQIGDFLEAFDFTQDGNYHPKLPNA